jgi:hypothetical protein
MLENRGKYSIIPSRGPQKDKTLKMIYQLDGDTLKIAMYDLPDNRPGSFDEKSLVIVTLKREKK